jgi:hypothetical protein
LSLVLEPSDVEAVSRQTLEEQVAMRRSQHEEDGFSPGQPVRREYPERLDEDRIAGIELGDVLPSEPFRENPDRVRAHRDLLVREPIC